MIEKRFKNEDDCWGYYTEIIDNEKKLDSSIPNPKKNLTIEELVDTLNELDEDFHDAITVLFEIQEQNRQLENNYNELKQLIHTMLRQIDVEKINTDNSRYSARIIFTREEFILIKNIWDGDD